MESGTPARSLILKIALILGVLALIGFVVAVLAVLFAQYSAREANRLQSMNNLKQIVLGLGNYEAINHTLPPHAHSSAEGKPLLSWRVLLLRYLEVTDQPGLHEEFRMDEPWDSSHNLQLVDRIPEVFRTPGLQGRPGDTSYLAVVGKDCAFDGSPEGKRANLIAADSPQTIVVLEADADRAVPWTKPDDWQFDPQQPTAGLGTLRSGGVIVARADGKVSMVPMKSLQSAPQDFHIPEVSEEAATQPQRRDDGN